MSSAIAEAPRARTVSFFSAGQPMSGVLRLPSSASSASSSLTSSKPPLLIFCAGMTLTKEVWLPRWAEALNALGYATLNFDFRGFGASGGPRLRLVPADQVVDVQNTLSFCETLDDVDAGRAAVVGVSLGAAVALGAAGVDDRVKACVAVGGPSDLWRVWSGLPNFPAFLEKVRAARRQATTTGEARTIRLSRLLSSDPETCALIERDAPSHPTWQPELTFESLLDLFAFRPEQVAAGSRATCFVTCEHDALIGKAEASSAFARCREPRRLVEIPGVHHHEIYGDGAGFAPTIAAIDAFLRDVSL